jgi:hypothetical protein
MLSRRLTQKIEALTDEAQAYIEAHIDGLLLMPTQCRIPRADLRLVAPAPAPPVNFRRVVAASHLALNPRAQPAKVAAVRRRQAEAYIILSNVKS